MMIKVVMPDIPQEDSGIKQLRVCGVLGKIYWTKRKDTLEILANGRTKGTHCSPRPLEMS